MFDLAWSELAIIGVVALVVVGPKDLPKLMRSAGKMAARARRVADEFRGQMNEALREAELDDLKSSINEIKSLNPAGMIRDEMAKLAEPVRSVTDDVNREWQSVDTSLTATASAITEIPDAAPSLAATPDQVLADVPMVDVPELAGPPNLAVSADPTPLPEPPLDLAPPEPVTVDAVLPASEPDKKA